jgi:hypothetical protein
MPTGWIYGQHDRGLYIVQTGQKEKREEDIRLGRLFGQWVQNAKAWISHLRGSLLFPPQTGI